MEPISKLSDAVIYVIKTTSNFKPQLMQLKSTLDRVSPIIVEIQNENRKLGATQQEQDLFIIEIKEAEELVNKCLKIKWNFFKRFTHSLKLRNLDQKLVRFFQIEVQALQSRDIKKTLEEVNYVIERLARLASDVGKTLDSGSSTVSSTSIERYKYGWPVPPLPMNVVGFDQPLKELKEKLLSDDDDMDTNVGKVVVVSAAGGSGKTTLVKMLCNDREIDDKFGKNIFFVTVSETPDFMASVNDLLNPLHFDRQVKFQGNEDAKNKLENFLRHIASGPILLVLDDVWCESYIKNFAFDIEGYKLLVTSRTSFMRYNVFKFDPLSDENAKIIFCNSSAPIPTIDETLVDQMVKCCKNHPLTLSVVGSSLNGKNEVAWKSMLNALNQGRSVLDLNNEVLVRLERSYDVLDEKLKQCFLDFGLFLEDQQIKASSLLDMWVHLYNHDDDGVDTLASVYEQSYRNLVDCLEPSEEDEPGATTHYCERQEVTQHDLLRQLAISLISKPPIEKRPRLIISEQNGRLLTHGQGQDQMASVEQIQVPVQARILSISTGEFFASRWCNMRVPEVEVLMLNMKSKAYTLPPFLKDMQKLKILHVEDHRISPKLDFQLVGCLANLTRIMLDSCAISSFGRSTLELGNLRKITFHSCSLMGDAIEGPTIANLKVWPKLIELEMTWCDTLLVYPGLLCRSVRLKKLTIKYCTTMSENSEELGNLTCLETLILRGCFYQNRLPDSIVKLQNLSILDISYCNSLTKLPTEMGSLGNLRTLYKLCTCIPELPPSMKNLTNTKVICFKEVEPLFKEFCNMETVVVEPAEY